MRTLALAAVLAVRAGVCTAQPAEGSPLPPTAQDRLRLSGEVSATTSTLDAEHEGWFNYSDYEYSTLRTVRLSLAGEVLVSSRVALLGEVRTTQFDTPEAYALYVRVRPWRDREIDVLAGRVPPTFGAFPRRVYAADNPLVGVPLAFQYLTAVRADALPRTPDDLAAMRARGWETSYPVGNTDPHPGLPLVSALRWDTGVQVRARSGPMTVLGAVTQGTLSQPRVRDDNGRPQFASRVAYAPHAALTVGVSGATGPYLSRSLASALPAGTRVTSFRQDAVGMDVEWSRDLWQLRGEALRSRWAQPSIDDPGGRRRLRADAWMLEGRYRFAFAPGVHAAVRVERLSFSPLRTSQGLTTWDAAVSRIELGGGWMPRQHLLIKAAWQHNRRDGGRVSSSDLATVQVAAWF